MPFNAASTTAIIVALITGSLAAGSMVWSKLHDATVGARGEDEKARESREARVDGNIWTYVGKLETTIARLETRVEQLTTSVHDLQNAKQRADEERLRMVSVAEEASSQVGDLRASRTTLRSVIQALFDVLECNHLDVPATARAAFDLDGRTHGK